MEDGLLYQNGKIKITRNVFYNGKGEQFVIANIRGLRDEKKSKSFLPFLLGLGVLAAQWFAHPFGSDLKMQGIGYGLGAALILLYFMRSDAWRIYLATPQGEAVAFKTSREAEFRQVSDALKRAIASH